MDIAGLGTVAMDVILQVSELPKEDGFAVVNQRSYLDGGSASNVMVQAARLGVACGFISQVGDDEIGNAIRAGLQKEGVDTSAMVVKTGGTSLHTTIVVGDDGRKMILLNMGDSFLAMKKEDVDYSFINAAKVFYTDLLPGVPAIEALKKAKQAGLKTVFNLQVGVPLMEQFGVPREDILSMLPLVDVFAPCREAFEQLTKCGSTAEEGIDILMNQYSGLLLLTLGSEGAVAAYGRSRVKVTAFNVQAVDTTGAGDSYIGAFMYAYLLKGMELERAMRFSSAAAAITCQKVGARSCPSLKEVEVLYAGY
jgi:sugar/nucleoside kinase (ribokinase family)